MNNIFFYLELKGSPSMTPELMTEGPGFYRVKTDIQEDLVYYSGHAAIYPFYIAPWDQVPDNIKEFFEDPKKPEKEQERSQGSEKIQVTEDFMLRMIAVSKANGSNFKLDQILKQ